MLHQLLTDKYVGLNDALLCAGTFIITFLALKFFMRLLPKDQGRQFAVNGALSEGKPRGAGIIFITSFAFCAAIFAPMNIEIIINIALIYAAMLTGYLDDAAEKPWGELKKGILDFLIAAGISVNFVYHNETQIDFLGNGLDISKPVYVILGTILVWASINVTNCTDGVDGLCGTLSMITILMFGMITVSYGNDELIKIMIMVLAAYVWFNASPSKLLMGDAGSRSIGVFIAVIAMHSGKPLMFIPLAAVMIVDGGLGLVKLSVRRFLRRKKFMDNIRTPIHDHMRKNKGWSDTQVVMRFAIIQMVIGLTFIYLI